MNDILRVSEVILFIFQASLTGLPLVHYFLPKTRLECFWQLLAARRMQTVPLSHNLAAGLRNKCPAHCAGGRPTNRVCAIDRKIHLSETDIFQVRTQKDRVFPLK